MSDFRMWVIAYVAILTGVVFVSSHVLEVKWVMISLLPWARYTVNPEKINVHYI